MSFLKEQKILKAKEISDKISKSQAIVVARYQGLTVKEIQALRKLAKEKDVEIKVYKNRLVKKAIENNIKVVPLSGPNAFLNGLVGSGIDSSHFLFYGFLDPKESKRKSELEKLKNIEFTLIFYEAPHRIMDTLKSIYEVLGNRQICVARELTKVYEEFIRGDVKSIIENYESFKGEMVIIVEKNQENSKNNGFLKGFLEKVNDLTSAGLSQKDAINAVSTLFNVNKNKLYKEVINIKKD